jgi:4-amino-4-deoxy-L-arabinose transferase-like glycosyltransferase
MKSHLYKLNLFLALLTFLLVSSRDLNYPGVQYDELLQARPAVNLVKGIPDGAGLSYSVQKGGHVFPVMNMEYMGAVKTYLLALAFSIFGIKVSVLRLTVILVALSGVYLTAKFAQIAFGRIPAAVCVWLLATDPSLIVCSRNDWGPVAIGFAMRGASLFLLARWWKSGGRLLPLIGAGAALGVGIYDKANFFWFVFGLVPAVVFLWWTSKERPRVRLLDLTLALAALLTASLPFWVYNLLHRWPTLRSLSDGSSMIGVIRFIPDRVGQVADLFNGHALDRFFFGEVLNSRLGLAEQFPLALALLAFVVLVTSAIATKEWRRLTLPLLTTLIFVQILTNPKWIWLHHWITIFPLQHLMVAQMIQMVSRNASSWNGARAGIIARAAPAALTACVSFAIFANVMTLNGYHRLVHERGGNFPWTDAIYPLAHELEARFPGRPVQVLDWGIANQLPILSEGRVRAAEPFWAFAPGKDVHKNAQALKALVANPANVFVMLKERPRNFLFPSPRPYLDEAAAIECATPKSEVQITNRLGASIFTIIEFSPGHCEDVKP